MKIDLAIINYNTCNHTENFINSLKASLKHSNKNININIYIGDNGPDDQSKLIKNFINKYDDKNFLIDVKRLPNNGYFGTLNNLLDINNINNSEVLILGNNDIIFTKNYILSLEELVNSKYKFKDSYCFVPRVETEDKFDDNQGLKRNIPEVNFCQKLSYSFFPIFQFVNWIKK